ncbi:hypothetical protein EK904_009447 [Melospiza melodia maxima]|nr:hypothetical protein EK904_009447 [Melospiza melodia maxima]
MPPQELLDYPPAVRRHSPSRGSGPELGIKCVLDPAQEFQSNSFHFWGIPAIETACRTQQFKF